MFTPGQAAWKSMCRHIGLVISVFLILNRMSLCLAQTASEPSNSGTASDGLVQITDVIGAYTLFSMDVTSTTVEMAKYRRGFVMTRELLDVLEFYKQSYLMNKDMSVESISARAYVADTTQSMLIESPIAIQKVNDFLDDKPAHVEMSPPGRADYVSEICDYFPTLRVNRLNTADAPRNTYVLSIRFSGMADDYTLTITRYGHWRCLTFKHGDIVSNTRMLEIE